MSNVVYTINKKYFDLFRVSCQSLIDNSTVSLNINIVTEEDEFDDNSKKIISDYFESQRDNIKLKFISSNLFKTLKLQNSFYSSLWFGDTVFLRLFLHDCIEDDLVTVIDADTLVLKNIDELLYNQYPMPIAGTLDLNYDKETSYPYFCSAVYKISLNYWRDNNLHDKVVELLKEKYTFPEQDIMNVLFKYNKTILPMKYCVQTLYNNLTQISALKNPSIIHFAGPNKPIHDSYKIKNVWDINWYEYETKTKKLKDELNF